MEAFRVDLRHVRDLENTLEADALLANVPHRVLLGSATHITKRSDVALCKPNLACNHSLQHTGCAWLLISSDRYEQEGIAVSLVGILGCTNSQG